MPELPEVETVVHYLKPYLQGRIIDSVEALNQNTKVFISLDPDITPDSFIGHSIKSVHRRGKFIVLNLDRGYISIHLRMTGRLMASVDKADKAHHFTARLIFQNGAALYFKDYRKFGRIYFSKNLDWLEKKLGIEPLSREFTSKWLREAFSRSGRMVKPLLLDQKFIAGLGNIYVDETLWKANIHPRSAANAIEPHKISSLHRSIRSILRKAIELNGTTIINFSFGENQTGAYTDHLQVFGKQNQPCPRCKTSLRKIRVAQRGTHICPHCQPL
jgi:formamidopyrimidine-DNA glycosylase